MARGWESKSVEAQQEEAKGKGSPSGPRLSREAAALSRDRENLRLARQRVLEQLASSTNLRHQKLLQDALADLEERASKLEGLPVPRRAEG